MQSCFFVLLKPIFTTMSCKSLAKHKSFFHLIRFIYSFIRRKVFSHLPFQRVMASILDSIFSSHTMEGGASMEIGGSEQHLQSLGDTQVIIIGGGITCSALAYALAKDGLRVHMIMEGDISDHDRSKENQLQAEECLKLIELGLEDCVAGRMSYNSQSLMRKIHNKASSLPSLRLEQGSVTSLVEDTKWTIQGVHYKNKLGKDLTANAPLTIVCNNLTLKRSPCSTIGAVFCDENVHSKRQPSTGGGMASALSDTILLRDLMRSLYNSSHDAISLSKCLECFYALRQLQPGCSGGGEFSNSQVALLPGRNPWQLMLLLRFSAVPVMWCWTLVTSISSPLSSVFTMLLQ